MGNNNQIHTRFSQQIHKQTISGFLRKLATRVYTPSRGHTLLLILCFGLAGVLIDLDHLIIRQTQMVRPLHLPIWIGLCIGGICYCAYLRRRVHHVGIKK